MMTKQLRNTFSPELLKTSDMNSDRIKEIQKTTAYPDSVSVQQALLQVWNECEQEKNTVAVNEPENIPDIDDYPQTDSRTYKNLDGTVNWKKYAMALKSYILSNEPKIIPEQECGKPLHEL